jgi:hypothetical protein
MLLTLDASRQTAMAPTPIRVDNPNVKASATAIVSERNLENAIVLTEQCKSHDCRSKSRASGSLCLGDTTPVDLMVISTFGVRSPPNEVQVICACL